MVLPEVEKGGQVRQMSQESPLHAGPEEKGMGRSSHRGAIL